MPDAEQRTGQRGHGAEVFHRQCHPQPGILHAHFDGQGAGAFFIQPQQASHALAAGQSQTVVGDYGNKDGDAGLGNAPLVQGYDNPDHHHNGRHGNQRKDIP